MTSFWRHFGQGYKVSGPPVAGRIRVFTFVLSGGLNSTVRLGNVPRARPTALRACPAVNTMSLVELDSRTDPPYEIIQALIPVTSLRFSLRFKTRRQSMAVLP